MTNPSVVMQVTNHPELHAYAAAQTVEALKRGANHDAMVGAAAAIVGAPPCSHSVVNAWRSCPNPFKTHVPAADSYLDHVHPEAEDAHYEADILVFTSTSAVHSVQASTGSCSQTRRRRTSSRC